MRFARCATFFVALATLLSVGCASQPPLTLRADQATLDHVTLATTRPGFSGAGYATGFKNEIGEIVWTVPSARGGVYDLAIRYHAPGKGKGYSLTVNDVGYDGFFHGVPDESFAVHDAGKVELAAGENVVRLGKGWAHYDIDSITLTPSKPLAKPKRVPDKLCHPAPSKKTRQLFTLLARRYGSGTFTGVINSRDRDYVRDVAGVTPAIMGGDLIEYSPTRLQFGSNPRGETERLIQARRDGHIVTLLWHWNAPRDLINESQHKLPDGRIVQADWWSGFYARATTFDFAAAMADPTSVGYAAILRDIDAIAEQLKKLQAARVPVLWRPLHESDGEWFWWGTKGPDEFKKLWRLLFDRLTHHHKLDNLIWVYTWNDPAWYPGDDVVDMIGIDSYPSHANDRQIGIWQRALREFDGRKMIALTEFGGVPDLPAMRRLGIHWSYFASWQGDNGPQKIAKPDLARIYRSDAAINHPADAR
jgi:mannan endo-1,4-beta-mannosidase